MRFVNSVEIERSVGVVFAYLADFEHVPEWNYAIEQTTKISEGPVDAGTTYRQVRKIPRRAEESFEVTAFEPERRLAIMGTLGPFASELEYRTEPIEGGHPGHERGRAQAAGNSRCSGSTGHIATEERSGKEPDRTEAGS
jgi:uncharacterized protein YndB with AHSA1/START domain